MMHDNYRNSLKKHICLFILFLLYPFLQSSSFSNEYTSKQFQSPQVSIPFFLQQQSESMISYIINPYFIKKAEHRLLGSANIIQKRGVMSKSALTEFLMRNNHNVDPAFVDNLISVYMQFCEIENINHDIAFAQMCLETGYLKYGGSVHPYQNNFCGLGAINEKSCGETFNTPELGVKAHIQHLKAYVSKDALKTVNVDPRFKYVDRGCVKAIEDLSGRWATDPEYGLKIKSILRTMYSL